MTQDGEDRANQVQIAGSLMKPPKDEESDEAWLRVEGLVAQWNPTGWWVIADAERSVVEVIDPDAWGSACLLLQHIRSLPGERLGEDDELEEPDIGSRGVH